MTGIRGSFGVFGRRQLIIGASAGIAGSLWFAGNSMADASPEILHSEEAIHQETEYRAAPTRIYEAIMDARQFDKLTAMSPEMKAGKSLGKEATKISREVGGPFTIFGGHIVGRNIELVSNQRISKLGASPTGTPDTTPSRDSNSPREAPEPKSCSITRAFPKGRPSIWLPVGRAITGSRCRSIWDKSG